MVSSLSAIPAITERLLESGDSHLPALVFVHGLTLSALVWANIFRDLSLLKFFYLVAYDMRGHGRSGKPDTEEEYSSSLYADDFLTVIEAFNVKKPIFVGWSNGGTVSTDVTTYLGPDALAGIVYTTAVPYLAADILTEWIQSHNAGWISTDNSLWVANGVKVTLYFTPNEGTLHTVAGLNPPGTGQVQRVLG